MKNEILDFNHRLAGQAPRIADLLARSIERALPEAEAKIWHRHPVWFLDGNPTVGYSLQKLGVRLMFWSGAGFDEPRLNTLGKKFRDASIFYRSVSEVDVQELERWLSKSRLIAWDYKNIVQRNGDLVRLR